VLVVMNARAKSGFYILTFLMCGADWEIRIIVQGGLIRCWSSIARILKMCKSECEIQYVRDLRGYKHRELGLTCVLSSTTINKCLHIGREYRREMSYN
jgi:hypothetical protein